MKHGRLIAAAATTGLVGSSLLLSIPAATAATRHGQAGQGQQDRVAAGQPHGAQLLRRSGTATATVKNQKIENLAITATGLTPDAPHAIHIHYGDDARNECPIMAARPDRRRQSTRTDGTLRLSTATACPPTARSWSR
jgi:Cu/Zn superoxide dismutase